MGDGLGEQQEQRAEQEQTGSNPKLGGCGLCRQRPLQPEADDAGNATRASRSARRRSARLWAAAPLAWPGRGSEDLPCFFMSSVPLFQNVPASTQPLFVTACAARHRGARCPVRPQSAA